MALLLLGCLLLAAAPQPTQSFRLLGYELNFLKSTSASTAAIPAAQTPETAAAKKAQAAQLKGAAQSASASAAAGQEPVTASIQSAAGSGTPEVRLENIHSRSHCCGTAQHWLNFLGRKPSQAN
jgi:hypothetical protein